jgi:hypothetical protein
VRIIPRRIQPNSLRVRTERQILRGDSSHTLYRAVGASKKRSSSRPAANDSKSAILTGALWQVYALWRLLSSPPNFSRSSTPAFSARAQSNRSLRRVLFAAWLVGRLAAAVIGCKSFYRRLTPIRRVHPDRESTGRTHGRCDWTDIGRRTKGSTDQAALCCPSDRDQTAN